MRLYRSITPEVYEAHRRFQLVVTAATRGPDETLAAVAERAAISESHLYQLQRRVVVALTPRRPGPKGRPQPAPAPRVVAQTFDPTSLDPATLTYVLHTEHVSIRGIQRVFDTISLPVPSRDTLLKHMGAAGRAARRLLERAKKQLRDKLTCLAADDIFLHRVPVKVVLEPVSSAVLEVWRWPGSHTAEDWKLFLKEWPALKLLVSDLGPDLVKAAREMKLSHQADLFHERQWWNDEVFHPLSRREARLAEALHDLWDRATTPGHPGRPPTAAIAELEALRAEAESHFYAAVRAEMKLLTLFESLDPEGRLWTEASMEVVMDHDVCPPLASIATAIGLPIWKHVWTHRTRWNAHRVLWDQIEVLLEPASTWTRTQVIDAMLTIVATETRYARATEWAVSWRCQQELAVLRAQVLSACRNVAQVEGAVRSLLDQPRRSSSLVEAFNAVVRGLQQVHRTVSNDMLALQALRWNLSPRTEGRRRGPSPFALLGVDFADDERPWYEVLIDEINRE